PGPLPEGFLPRPGAPFFLSWLTGPWTQAITGQPKKRCKRKLGEKPPLLPLSPASGPCGMPVEVAPERPRHGSRLAVPDRAAVDANHRHDDLACGGGKGLAGRLGLLYPGRSPLKNKNPSP